MEAVFGIVIVVVLILVVFGPLIGRFLGPLLQKWAVGKMEDNIRRMAGMPTRKEEKKARKKARKEGRKYGNADGWGNTNGAQNVRPRREGPASVMRAFAEDVEFTEIKEYSVEVKIGKDHDEKTHIKSYKYKEESQIEDAEFEEIRK